jgi:alanyl-tRNA synthetase
MFEIDTVMSIINKISGISAVRYGKNMDSDISIRVITDHIRSATMMICDGVLPSNEGRGYVLRRLLRRAARHGRLLGIPAAFLYDVCETVIEENKGPYPDLIGKAGFITRVIRAEEESFGKTIDGGMAILTGFIEKLKADSLAVLSGADAFKLFDTYGFPLDLTVDILSDYGMTADENSFDEHMDEQRARARKAREALGDLAWAGIDLGLDNTPTQFTGYENMSDSCTVLAIITQGEISSSIREGDEGIVVLDKTPFYAELGGQSADFGVITGSDAIFDVTGVQVSKGDKYLHHGKMRSGMLAVDNTITAEVDIPRRHAIMRAHTATHLMHDALRSVLGEHVNQAGSLVEPDNLRFDFTHFSALTKEEIADIERRVNDAILDGLPVTADEMPIDNAKKLGATALFGEKYGDVVRVVRMGESIELCGGTHLENTAKTGAFTIHAEFSVASGVRRIEATTGIATLEALRSARGQLYELAGLMKAGTPEELPGKLEQVMATTRELRTKLDVAMTKEADIEALRMLTEARDIGGLSVAVSMIEDADADVDKLKHIEDTLRDRNSSIVAVIALVKNGKITILAACGKTAIEKGIKAGELVREITKLCGGSGGGKPEFAMGGGKDVNKLKAALEAVDVFVKEKLGR